jgi:site-specific recombinase XerD
MFDVYFCPRVVHRLQSDAHAEILKGFLDYLHGRGHARLTIQNYVHAAELFLRWIRRHRYPLTAVDELIVRRFACRDQLKSRPAASTHAALRHLLRHLRDKGLISPRATTATPAVEKILSEYDAYLHGVAGLAAATRLYHRRYAREFLDFVFHSQRIQWKRICPSHVQLFIGQYGENGRISAARVGAGSLRSFLRWLEYLGRITPNLIGAVPHTRHWRLVSLPTVMTDDQLQRFLTSFDQSCPSGCRDYAMAVCMVDLGLRVAEVAGLTVDDVEVNADKLRLSTNKSRRDRVLPMPQRVRQAVITYLRRDRLDTDHRQLFVRHRVPLGAPVTRELIRGVMRRAYARVPGCESWTGTHVLRHTAATRLHRAGADLKRVADILGHRSIDTTAIYTKVDVERLHQVALPWPCEREV